MKAPPNSCPASVRGALYPTIKAAAKACGVAERTAHRQLARHGHLDLLGLPRVRGPRPDRSKPVSFGPRQFSSITAASKVLGLYRATIRRAMKGPNSSRQLVLLRLIDLVRREAHGLVTPAGKKRAPYRKAPYKGVSVEVRGVLYPSISAAARSLGLTQTTVQAHLEKGTLDRAGLGTARAQVFIYAGETYPSLGACARAYGVHRNTFNSRIKAGRDPVTGLRG